MTFLIGFVAVYGTLWIAELLGGSQSKSAKNYQELMKREPFKVKDIDDE